MSKQQEDSTQKDFDALETHLAGTLRPVTPPKDLAQRLREHVHFPERGVIVSRLQEWNRLFLVFGSVMSGVLVIITVARALYYLFWRRSLG